MSSGLYEEGDTPSAGALAASLGCGNPTALTELLPGQDVLDLGSGGGLDVLLSARRIAPGGMAYGLDMTDEMLELAERNRAEAGITNATFIKGTIEDIPLPAASVDVVISNCVINLSTDKDAVLREAFRVLRPGGRFAVVRHRAAASTRRRSGCRWWGCGRAASPVPSWTPTTSPSSRARASPAPSIQVTRTYTREDLVEMAGTLPPGSLPDGSTPEEAIVNLEGRLRQRLHPGREGGLTAVAGKEHGMHYVEHGTGRAVLVLHGAGVDHRETEGVLRARLRRRGGAAPDLPGPARDGADPSGLTAQRRGRPRCPARLRCRDGRREGLPAGGPLPRRVLRAGDGLASAGRGGRPGAGLSPAARRPRRPGAPGGHGIR